MLQIATVISFITPWLLRLSIVLLIVSIIFDLIKKKFYWSKLALIVFIIAIGLLIIEITMIYTVTGDILKEP